jgi:carboxymethylenebutenolidase
MSPTFYDPNSIDERQVPLPSAPRVLMHGGLALQPPLARRGSGPGLIAFLPPSSTIVPTVKSRKSLDPEPTQKWAEEGFAVIEVSDGNFISEVIDKAIVILMDLQEVDTKDKFAIAGRPMLQ